MALDGTERRRQRPTDPGQQQAHYSGKKKTHTDKNLLLVNEHTRKVVYLGPTIAGNEVTPIDGDGDAIKLIALGVALSMATLSAFALRGRLAQGGPEPAPAPAAPDPDGTPEPAVGDRTR